MRVRWGCVESCLISTPKAQNQLDHLQQCRGYLLFRVSKAIRSYQDILLQDFQRFLRFFKHGAVSRLLKRVESLRAND